jgi:hypothetical protein
VDTFGDRHDRKFIAAAKRLPPGTTLLKWSKSVVATMEGFCQKSRAFRKTTLGGGPARQFAIACPSYDVIVATAVHRGRGYILLFVSPTMNAAAADYRTYEAGRRSFRFTRK